MNYFKVTMFRLQCYKNVKKSIQSINSGNRKMSLFSRGINFFFKKNLLLTNSITSGGFMAIGDLVQQEMEYQSHILPQRYDWGRASKFIIIKMYLCIIS